MTTNTILVSTHGETEEHRKEVGKTVLELVDDETTVVIAHAFTEEGFNSAKQHLNAGKKVSSDALARRITHVQEIVEVLDSSDIDVEVRGRIGDKAETILAVAEEIDADQVVVGGQQRNPTGKAVFGSTAQEVLLNSPCPTTFVLE